MRRAIGIVAGICFFFLVVVVALTLIPEANPPIAEVPIEPDPSEPVDPINPTPTEPVKPIEPTKPTLVRPVSFSKKAERAEDRPFHALMTDILCRIPEGTEITVVSDVRMLESHIDTVDRPIGEYCLEVYTDIGIIRFLGVDRTQEIEKSLGETHFDPDEGGKPYAEIPAGTMISRSSYPLRNDWGEDINLVIIVQVYSKYVDSLEPLVASILEALR